MNGHLNLRLTIALFIAGPFVLWQIWQFVAAGLYKQERSVVFRYFPFSAMLFVGGAVFGYFMMVPYALFFLARMTLGQIHYWESIDNYWSFLTSLTLAFMLFVHPFEEVHQHCVIVKRKRVPVPLDERLCRLYGYWHKARV